MEILQILQNQAMEGNEELVHSANPAQSGDTSNVSPKIENIELTIY